MQAPEVRGKMTTLERKPFSYKLLNGQRFISLPRVIEKRKFKHFTINFGVTSLPATCSPDFLTPAETGDVEASLKEIKEGKIKKFKCVDDFLRELKT